MFLTWTKLHHWEILCDVQRVSTFCLCCAFQIFSSSRVIISSRLRPPEWVPTLEVSVLQVSSTGSLCVSGQNPQLAQDQGRICHTGVSYPPWFSVSQPSFPRLEVNPRVLTSTPSSISFILCCLPFPTKLALPCWLILKPNHQNATKTLGAVFSTFSSCSSYDIIKNPLNFNVPYKICALVKASTDNYFWRTNQEDKYVWGSCYSIQFLLYTSPARVIADVPTGRGGLVLGNPSGAVWTLNLPGCSQSSLFREEKNPV